MNNALCLTLQNDQNRYTWGYFLEDVAARFGSKEAIRFEGHSVTYLQLLADSRSLAKALANAGVVKGARVAVHMANRPEFAVVSFAAAMIGAVLVPINTFSTVSEREYILRHCDASVLIFSSKLMKYDFLEEFKSIAPQAVESEPGKLRFKEVPYLRRVICFGIKNSQGAIESWDSFIKSGNTFPDDILDAMTSEVYPSDEGIIIYTSGTTSKPKGVLHLQRAPAIMSWRFAEDLRYTSSDRIWTTYPFFWSAGICFTLGACLGSGAVLVLQETFDPVKALNCFVDESVTGIQAWPHQMKAMADNPIIKTIQLPTMSKLDYSSPLAQYVGITEDNWGIHGSFGMTETFTLVSNIPADSPAHLRKNTAGRPLPGTKFRILDQESGEILPLRQEGEIAVKGISLMRGYYKVDPENIFDEDGFYRTQDRGFIDADGYLHWSGRISNMIKTGGANVSPLEIETTLEKFPNMRVGIPFGAPHPTLGEVVVLCAVASKGCALGESDIQAYLNSKLAAYKRPKAILVFQEEELSFTGNQKIQVNNLVEKAMRRLRDERRIIEGVNYADYLQETPVDSNPATAGK